MSLFFFALIYPFNALIMKRKVSVTVSIITRKGNISRGLTSQTFRTLIKRSLFCLHRGSLSRVGGRYVCAFPVSVVYLSFLDTEHCCFIFDIQGVKCKGNLYWVLELLSDFFFLNKVSYLLINIFQSYICFSVPTSVDDNYTRKVNMILYLKRWQVK